jgi:endonuclease YncB( thermonuclease family)
MVLRMTIREWFKSISRESIRSRIPQDRETWLLVSIGGVALIVGIVTLFALPDMNWRTPDTRVRPPIEETAAQAPALVPETIEPKPDARQARLPSRTFHAPLWLEPPYEPLDGKTFRAGGHMLRLDGIEAPERLAICQYSDKTLWSCGLQARVALYNIVRTSPLKCLPKRLSGLLQTPTDQEPWPVHCSIGDRDVAIELVRSGFAQWAGFPTVESQQAEREARQAKRGIWRQDSAAETESMHR